MLCKCLLNNFKELLVGQQVKIVIQCKWTGLISDTFLNFIFSLGEGTKHRAVWSHAENKDSSYQWPRQDQWGYFPLCGPDAPRSPPPGESRRQDTAVLLPPAAATESASFDLQLLRCPAATNQPTETPEFFPFSLFFPSALSVWIWSESIYVPVIHKKILKHQNKHTV